MPEALRQVDALLQHYEEWQRNGAARVLLTALEKEERQIERDPAADTVWIAPLGINGLGGRGTDEDIYAVADALIRRRGRPL